MNIWRFMENFGGLWRVSRRLHSLIAGPLPHIRIRSAFYFFFKKNITLLAGATQTDSQLNLTVFSGEDSIEVCFEATQTVLHRKNTATHMAYPSQSRETPPAEKQKSDKRHK